MRLLRIPDKIIGAPDPTKTNSYFLLAYLARRPLSFQELEAEGLEPHKVFDVILAMTDDINHNADISQTLELKIASLKEHKSQLPDPAQVEKRIRDRAQNMAKEAPFRYAEGFRKLTLRR